MKLVGKNLNDDINEKIGASSRYGAKDIGLLIGIYKTQEEARRGTLKGEKMEAAEYHQYCAYRITEINSAGVC
jgi:hypothetical protein